MKTTGVDQFLRKKFKLLGVDGKWKDTLGNVPESFIAIVYGKSGNGKTEFLIQLAKYLATFGKVAWWSYEQRHGYDLQMAVKRNNMEEVAGNFVIVDPIAKVKPGFTLFDELNANMAKQRSPQFYIIDSYDYIKLTFDQYVELRNKYANRKTIIFVSHAKGDGPKTSIAEAIEYDGGMGILVKRFIAYPKKNRYGGFEPYIIWEEKARERNPKFFQKEANQ